jgi:5-methylcytosine-specific restriction endonuclease McrA
MSVFNKHRRSGVTRIIHDRYSPTGSSESWYSISDRVRERDGYTCTSCGTYLGKGKGDIHHIRPLSRGGTTTMANLTLKCKECHADRHIHLRKK